MVSQDFFANVYLKLYNSEQNQSKFKQNLFSKLLLMMLSTGNVKIKAL